MFIGGYGTKFNFLNFLNLKRSKKKQIILYLNDQICIHTIKFEFKYRRTVADSGHWWYHLQNWHYTRHSNQLIIRKISLPPPVPTRARPKKSLAHPNPCTLSCVGASLHISRTKAELFLPPVWTLLAIFSLYFTVSELLVDGHTKVSFWLENVFMNSTFFYKIKLISTKILNNSCKIPSTSVHKRLSLYILFDVFNFLYKYCLFYLLL
jgi:hypothetical protein